MSSIAIAVFVGFNIALIYALMAVPLGVRTIRVARDIAAARGRLWSAVHPAGADAGWSGEVLSAEPAQNGLVRQRLSWDGRDGQPIERVVRIEDVRDGESFSLRVVDDSSLDQSFWQSFRESTRLDDAGEGVRVEISQTDSYRGLAFLAFRYFRLRRQLAGLDRWATTGRKPAAGVFEHPLTQVGFAVLSALILWVMFGMTARGLMVAVSLTMVVALHELGHMAAFRLMGHRRVRMIFVPILGGIAIGGRPYDSRFEVAFVALMGAGFSAFVVPLAMAAAGLAENAGNVRASAGLGFLAGLIALFNLANLVPVWRFDGGQVLRQICRGRLALVAASFALLSAFMLVGLLARFDATMVLVAGAVFATLSLITVGRTVQPREELKPLRRREAMALGAALLAAFTIHASALVWLAERTVRKDPAPVAAALSIPDGDALAPRIGPALDHAVGPEGHAVQA